MIGNCGKFVVKLFANSYKGAVQIWHYQNETFWGKKEFLGQKLTKILVLKTRSKYHGK
jgi:hypothetical protein